VAAFSQSDVHELPTAIIFLGTIMIAQSAAIVKTDYAADFFARILSRRGLSWQNQDCQPRVEAARLTGLVVNQCGTYWRH